MPSTIASDAEVKFLLRELKESRRGIFVIASGSRATPEYLEAIVADTGRPAFMVTVLTMHNQAAPGRAMEFFERCQAAIARGREVYIHTNCQPLSFDFNLRDPYILYSHDAFDRVKPAVPEEKARIYREASFRERLRDNFRNPAQGILFYGDWSQVELDGVPVTRLAAAQRKDALDFVFDLPLDTQLVAKLFQNDDAGVAPLLRHPAGVIALSDAGAHLIYFCDAGFGLHFLAALGARHRHLHAGGRRAPPDERPGAPLPHPQPRLHRGGQLGRPRAVRSRAGGCIGPGEALRSSRRRNPQGARSDRTARRMGERTMRFRRRATFQGECRPGPRA
jgi:hypothetical protein